MKNCGTSFDAPGDPNIQWCYDHELFTKHIAPDGVSPVCEAFAIFEGCSCCHANHHKSFLSDRQKIDDFILTELLKTANVSSKAVIRTLLHEIKNED